MKRYSITNHPVARSGFNVEENETGVWVMARDALDVIAAKDAALDWSANRIDALAEEKAEVQIELAKAHDLIKRIVHPGEQTDKMTMKEFYEHSMRLRAEADAMTKEG